MRWQAMVFGLALLGVVPGQAMGAPARPAAGTRELVIRYRSGGHVYLNHGRAAGLQIGQQLVSVRAGKLLGRLEVVFVSEHSATCRVIEELGLMADSDRVLRPGEQQRRTGLLRQVASGSLARRPVSRTSSSATRPDVATPVGFRLPMADTGAGSNRRRQIEPTMPWARGSGTISVYWTGFKDGAAGDRNVDDMTGRVSMSLRDLGGADYDLRIRARTRQINRSNVGHPGIVDSETRNRLYELSLRHDPVGGRFNFVLGRVGVRPFVGLGYIDGALGQVRLTEGFAVGAFAGAVPVTDGITFDFGAHKVGAFARFGAAAPSRPRRLDIVVAGVRESYTSGDRDFLSLETSYSTPRWAFFQRAEVDRSLPTANGTYNGGSGLSTLSLSTTYRLSDRSRISVGYNERRDAIPGGNRLDTNLFESRFRNSVRVGLSVAANRSVSFTVNGAVRSERGTQARTYSGGAGVSYRWGRAWLGTNYLLYDGEHANGYVASARAGLSLSHSLRLNGAYTRYSNTDKIHGSTRTNSRFQFGAWVDLPSGMFLQGGLELSSGPELDGSRAIAEAGFRF